MKSINKCTQVEKKEEYTDLDFNKLNRDKKNMNKKEVHLSAIYQMERTGKP